MKALGKRPGTRLISVWRGPTAWILVLGVLLVVATQARGTLTLVGFAIEDPATRDVVERYTLARQLPTVRVVGRLKTTNWILDRPPLAATLARHLHPPLERYHVTGRGNGLYTVDDMGALRGSLRLVAGAPERRVYLVEGQFRSLAHLLTLSGSMVFTLTYQERREGSESFVDFDPQLFIRLDNVLVHGVLKILAPLIHGVVDRRAEKLTTAAQIISRRLTHDPQGLYREIRTWADVRPADLEEYRHAFHILADHAGEGG